MQARDKHLDWLEGAMSEVKQLAEPITAHNGMGMVEDLDAVRQHLDIILVCAPAG